MRAPVLLTGSLAIGVVLGAPASAKEGVRAKLDAPVTMSTAAGKTVRVAWRLVDEDGRPFGGGIYLRVSRCEHGPLKIRATVGGSGRYVARVTVPKGGMRRLVVGLPGWRIIGERKERADALFPFDPPLEARGRCR
jgi:hypothetical protein